MGVAGGGGGGGEVGRGAEATARPGGLQAAGGLRVGGAGPSSSAMTLLQHPAKRNMMIDPGSYL